MSKILKFTGTVGTIKVGSGVKFSFEIYEEDLPTNPDEREEAIDEIALEALWESGVVDWSYEQVGEEEA